MVIWRSECEAREFVDIMVKEWSFGATHKSYDNFCVSNICNFI